jgi:hypothetical protein
MLMPQTMTLDEKLATLNRASELKKSGDFEGYDRLVRTVPLPFYIAKVMKEKVGADYLINGGWNLSEAAAEFGQNWLSR